MKALISIPPAKPDYVARAAFAEVLSKVNKGEAREDILRNRYPDDRVSLAILNTRAAVDPAKTGEAGWAAELVQDAFRGFLTGLAPLSAAARLIALGVPASLGSSRRGIYPARSGNPGTVPWVGESGEIPVAARALTGVTVGPAKKIALITTMTREMARRGDAEAVFTQQLREDAAASLDLAYLSTSGASASAHAGLLNGVSPLPASSAGGEAAMKADLAALAAAAASGGSGQVVFVTSTERAAQFAILAPELASRVTLLGSPGVPAARVVAVDPASLLHASDPEPTIDASTSATLHMEDTAPEPIGEAGSPNVVAAPVVSLYQTDSVALRILADIAFAKRRAGAVAYIDDADWSI